jgi:ankyrin repeat protein
MLTRRVDLDINLQDCHGRTGLHIAALHNRMDTVNILLAHPKLNVFIMDQVKWNYCPFLGFLFVLYLNSLERKFARSY